jgi:ketosteroid isomerase-like protein
MWMWAAAVAATLVAGGAACGGGARTRPAPTLPPTPEAVVTQVKGTVEQWRQAHEVRSMEALAQVYAQVPELIYVSQGRLAVGWQATQEVIQAFFYAHTEIKITLGQLQIVALGGEGAVASGAITRRFGDGVTTIEETGGIVLVFRRVNDGWKIVAQNYSYAPPQ